MHNDTAAGSSDLSAAGWSPTACGWSAVHRLQGRLAFARTNRIDQRPRTASPEFDRRSCRAECRGLLRRTHRTCYRFRPETEPVVHAGEGVDNLAVQTAPPNAGKLPRASAAVCGYQIQMQASFV